MSKWVEYDPWTGTTETNVADDDEGTITVHKEQDVTELLDRNADLRNTGAADNGIKKGLWLYASIPLAVQYEMLTKHGINIHNKDHWPRMFELINTDYPYLKTTNKTHALKGQGKIYAAPKNSPKKAIWTPPGQSSITH